ncbi:MAG: hypothetical protein BroJett029_42740 [Alphaproteobacteria bacterium]|nr:MAG: hypothetical protein BroJett029_42740 [Alphaproteobacteria bacterium]
MTALPFRSSLALLAGILAAGSLAAQPASATFRPALLEAYSAGFSATARNDLDRGGPAGRVAVARADLSFTGRTALSEATTVLHGLAWASNRLDLTGPVRLPDQLDEVTLSLGLQHRASPQWSLGAYLRPGFYGDTLDTDGFNAPLLATAMYHASRDLSWIFGFSANAASDNPFIPIAGVRWQFAPEWTLNIGFPRAGIAWKSSEAVTWHLGATVQGGAYYVGEDFGAPTPATGRLARTWLEYREIRTGLGAEVALSAGVTLAADIGVAVDQRFDYFDRGYKLKGETPLFLRLAIQGRF